MFKYGMKHSDIKYWQNQAWSQYRYNGIYAGRSILEDYKGYVSAQVYGHSVIILAAVASPEHLKAVLEGTRGRRWK